MARRPITQENLQAATELSPAEWLRRAPKAFAADLSAMIEKRAEALRAELELAQKKAKEAESQLRELGELTSNSHTPSAPSVTVASRHPDGEPAPDWSVLRLVKHYLRDHSRATAGEVSAFVTSIRFGEDKNVHSILYKYSRKPGDPIRKTGDRGAYRYSLKEDAGE